MKKTIIVVNAYTQSEHELNQPQRLQRELEALGVHVEILRNSPAVLSAEADFCVYLDKDKYAAQALEKRMRLFNRAKAIEICDDKMLTHLALDGFPTADTLPSLLCYSPAKPVLKELLDEAESRFGYPLVVKECHGSLGKQVYLVKDRKELEQIAERLKLIPHLYQKFVSESAGKDLRVILVGGKVVAAMKRVSDTDFRSNAELGGRGEKVVLDEGAIKLCEAVAKKLELDYCGIDLLFSSQSYPERSAEREAEGSCYLVCEVNSNAFFGTIEQVSGVNVAKAYAEHIYATSYEKHA